MMNTRFQHSVRSSAAWEEESLGISARASPADPGWHGDIRLRYTDFQVYEIGPDGIVVHLKDCSVPKVVAVETGSGRGGSGGDGHDGQSAIRGDAQPDTEAGSVTAAGAGTGAKESKEPPQNPQSEGGEGVEGGEVSAEISTEVSAEDVAKLDALVGKEVASDLVQLYQTSLASEVSNNKPRPVVTDVIPDKAVRSQIHQAIRTIFHSRLDTWTDTNGAIQAIVLSKTRRGRAGGRSGGRRIATRPPADRWSQGEYLHFTLYKENRDTMDAIQHVSRVLGLKPSHIGSAGTKDRRAATAQRCSVRFLRPEALARANGRVYGVTLGDFGFRYGPVMLGSHKGNEFVITVKNCRAPGATDLSGQPISTAARVEDMRARVGAALRRTASNGFINYFGHQRFGTHTTGTHDIGKLILRGDFEGAVKAILSHDGDDSGAPDGADGDDDGDPPPPPPREGAARDAYFRNKACVLFARGEVDEAVRVIPRRYSAETSVMTHLGRPGKRRDFVTAILVITRGLRNMYLHAYQSLVWNHAASRRWELYGPQVVAGDLVLEDDPPSSSPADHDHDPDPDPDPDPPDSYLGLDNDSYSPLRARPLSADEAASGAFTIWDVVLPCAGHNVVYPANAIGEFYVDFMGRAENGGLDPHAMRRPQREFSLDGRYRKLLGRFLAEPSWEVQAYARDDEQLRETDLDVIRQQRQGQQKQQQQQQQQQQQKKQSADADRGGGSMRGSKRGRADEGDKRNGRGGDVAKKARLGSDDDNGGGGGGGCRKETAGGTNNNSKEGEEDVTTASRHGHPQSGVSAAEKVTAEKEDGGATGIKVRSSSEGEETVTTAEELSTVPPPQVDETGAEEKEVVKKKEKEAEKDAEGQPADKIAVIITFQLATSAYATVVLRELMSRPPPDEEEEEEQPRPRSSSGAQVQVSRASRGVAD